MPQRQIRIAVQVGQYGIPWSALLATARDAEAVGVDLLFNWDHFFGPGPDSSSTHLECWTVLAAWAASTARIELGPLVSIAPSPLSAEPVEPLARRLRATAFGLPADGS